MYHLKNRKGSVGLCVAAVVVAAGLLVGATLLQPAATAQAQGDSIYVDWTADGNATGTTWTDAFTNVQDALTEAGYGDVIWVAAGVYYPDEGTGQTDGDRGSTFELASGVELYGGFLSGGGPRDWEANVTVLSGDLGGDDTTDDHGVVTDTANISGTNAYHVVTGNGVTETAVLDGFTITAGTADYDLVHNRGGGMYNESSSPTLTNVTFSGNSATYGGGMSNNSSSPTLTNVTFGSNSAVYGGGMYNESSSLTLTNVTFSGNSANEVGGGMYSLSSSPTLTNVTFSGNSANYGGGMYDYSGNPTLTSVTFSGNSADVGGGMYNHLSSPTLTNVTFSGNSANDGGGGMVNNSSSPTLTNVTFSGNSTNYGGGGMYNHSSSPTLMNCVLWGNAAGTAGPEIYNGSESTPTISYSDIEGSGGNGSWDTDLGIDDGDNIDADPLFVDRVPATAAPTTAGDNRLQLGSPAIDVGNNTAVPLGVMTDLDGNPRIVDGTGDGDAVVDMGAYERQQTRPVGGTTVADPLSRPQAAVAALFGLLLTGAAVAGFLQRRA